ncbi:hypothetical protein MTO96_043939 [Rhipicephalus appendiculatus]
MANKQAEASRGPPKAWQARRQAAADDNTAGPSNEASAVKRPRGRPPKGVSGEPLAPKPIATTAARKVRKTADATQPASERSSTSQADATKAPTVSRRKRSRSSSPSSTNDTASEAPERGSARRKASRGISRHSSRSRHGGRARKARSPKHGHAVGKEPPGKEEAQQEPPPRPVQELFPSHERAARSATRSVATPIVSRYRATEEGT